MRSTFHSFRMFNDQNGWYVVMRASDKQHLIGPKHKFIANQHLMGPFLDKHKAEDWLKGFLTLHFENRKADDISTMNTRH